MSMIRGINGWLRRYPSIRRIAKRLYQLPFYLVSSKPRIDPGIRVIAESDDDTFFGYYDKCPWNRDQRYFIYVTAKEMHRNVCAKGQSDIVLFDAELNVRKTVASTNVCNTQQGCMLQWLGPEFRNEIIYNDFVDGSYKSVILDVLTLKKRIIDYPVYAVSPDGRFAYTLDFARLHRLRPGYGYDRVWDKTKDEKIPEGPCITKIDLCTNAAFPILYYPQLVQFENRPEMDGAEHKVNHIMISPNAKRIMFLHRWITRGKKYSRLITCDCDGGDLYNLLDDDMVSHCNWIDDETIIAYAHKNGIGDGYFILKDKTNNWTSVFSDIKQDGHPSLSPDRNHVITDTYPDKSRKQHLYLCSLATNETARIATVFAPFRYDNDTRCDLHPRFSWDGKRICFDAVFEGRRKIYEMSIDKFLNKSFTQESVKCDTESLSDCRSKILYIVSTLENKGPMNQLFGLVSNLDKNRFAPHVLTLSPEPSDSKLQLFKDAGIKVDSLNLSRIAGFIVGFYRLKKFVEVISPDLIHTHGIRADGMAIRLRGLYNHCNTIHNNAYDDYTMKYGKAIGTLLAKSHISIVKKIKKPIACSKSIADRIYREQGIQIDYIQNGIDDELYSPVSIAEKKRLRAKLGLDQGRKIFIASGALIILKDPLVILKAFKKAEVADSAQLVVIGGGDLQSECEGFANESILIKGKVTNVVDYLRASDVYVSASRSEGLPNSVLEALGVGLPVILSDIESHKEILEKNNGIGALFKTGDVEQLANLIREYAAMDMGEKSKAAREVLCKHFSAKLMSQKYQALYDSIIDRSANK